MLWLASLALVLVLTPVALRVAVRHGALDHPGPLKRHKEAVPYLGGMAIVVAFALAVVVASAVRPPTSGFTTLGAILGLGLLLAAVGLLDDIWHLPVWLRLVLEIGAGVVLASLGVTLHLAGVPDMADAVISVVWVVVVTNAFNLLDNVDGLSAGCAALSALALFAIAVLRGEFLVAALAVALSGCAAGFLRHNFHPAKIYMGDAGSLFLGFLLAALTLKLRDHPATAVDMTALVCALGVALFDTGFVTVTRLARGQSPFQGGQDHTSHRLVRMGLSVPAAVGLIYGVAVVLAGLAIAFSEIGRTVRISGLVAVVAVGLVAGTGLALVPAADGKANDPDTSGSDTSGSEGQPP